MHGAHLIKFWSKTQGLVALSSAEAELYGCVKASAEAIGLTNLFDDLGELGIARNATVLPLHLDQDKAQCQRRVCPQ